jgi:hypothetical protein
VSDMELAGASLRGADQHWELLPAQVRVTDITNRPYTYMSVCVYV